ncbi:MAG: DMT family transporter [Solirubrobacteraceae bacterium]|nr:DMT family transporter [Solirubrobacteraceae bacterium]
MGELLKAAGDVDPDAEPVQLRGTARLMLLVVSILVGALVTLQAPINAELGKHVGEVSSSVVSFGVGFLVLLVLAGVLGQLQGLGKVGEVAWPYFLGGVIGAAFVLLALVAVPKIGAGPLTAAAVSGQLIMAVVIDRFGWIGVPQHDLTPSRVIGVVLLIAGLLLVSKK